MNKGNDGYVVALDGFIKWRENTVPTNLTHFMSYKPRQDIGMENPLYDTFLPTDFFTPTQLRFAEIFPQKKDAEKLISFLTARPDILTEHCLFYPMLGAKLNLRVQKIAIHVVVE